MNWFIISRDFHVAATITTDNPTGLQIFDDTENTVIENNCVVGSYDFSVNNAHPDAVALEMGSYVVFYNKRNELKMYTLVTFDTDENIAKWHAEDVGMDLLQETATAWDYKGATHPIAWYLENLVLYDTGWTIGVNEVANMTRSLVYTGQSDTQLKRLGDVANAFDGAEITFTIRMEGNRVKEQLVNIRRKVGRVQTDTRYIDERNIKSLTSTGSIESLRTAMLGIGSVINKPDGSQGDPLTFTNISYDDGNYYSPKGHNKIYDRNGRTKWSRFKAFGYKGQGEFDGYMVGTYTYDTEDANELLQRTLANLKTVNNPVVTYEAKLHEIDADIGDYLQMADNKYTPTLYLQARLVGISVCYTQDGLDVGVLGDYTKLQSAIDPRVQQMFDRLATTIVNNFTWTRYAEDANGKGMTAAPNIRTTHVAFLSNQKTGVPSDDPADYAGHWVLIKGDKGDKGADGEDGVAGKDGVGVKTTTITYAQSTNGTTPPTASWTASVPTLIKGQFLWTRTVWVYTDSSTETGYTVSYNAKDGNSGSDGRAGKDGVGISSTVIEYVGAVSGTSNPTSGWSTTIPAVPAGQYLWTRTTWKYTDGTSEQGFTNALMGRTGAAGRDGSDGKDGVAGKDGIGVKSTTITYQASTSGTTAPTGAWVASPTAVAGQYQWTRTVWTYTDGTSEVGYSVGHIGVNGATGKDGVAGKPGVGIKSTTITYQASTSGTTVPTGTWVSSPPSVPGGNYLWTRTVWSYTDSTSETGYSIAKAGEKGADGAAGKDGVAGKDGLGIKSTVIAYQLSSSGTTTPTGTWSATVPALAKGQYLWTRTTLTYTDNSSEPVYSVSYVAKDGNNGANGVAGKDGVGIKTTAITYATSTSGTSAPTSGWVSAPPSAAAGQFIWTRTIWTYTDNTTETGYSVGKIGEKGDKGDTGVGIPGTPGTDGRTPYLHTAWANSFDGKNGFSTDVSTNKSYMGTYVNFTEADPTDPALYNWIELVGALVIGGRNYLLDTDTPWQMRGSGGVNQSSSMKWLFTFGTIKQAPFRDGDYVTVSFDYMSVGSGAYGTIMAQFNDTPWGSFNGGEPMKDNGHFVRTIPWQSGWTTSGTATGIQIRMDNVATTRTVTVYNMQFESGNKATDHKVAPEDTQALIDSLQTPNLVYNAGLQGTYKNGLDGWAFSNTIPDKWYKTSQPSSMIGGVNALAISGSLPANGTPIADSKPMTVQAGNVVSASIRMKIGTDSGSSIYMAAEIHFTNDSGAQVGSNVQIGSVNNKTDYASFEMVNVSVPTGATRIGIRCYARNNSSTPATVHAFWCKPVINYGDKAAPFTDNQGSGADITQTNDALIALNDVFDKTVVPVASITAPPNPKEGQGWWVLNSSQQMIGFKIYKNGAWADSPIQQSAMNIGTLNGNIINGATINSSNFNVAFDETEENTGRHFGPYFKGTQVIKNGSYLADYQYKGTTQTGFTHITPDGLISRINNSDGSLLSQVTMGLGQLSLSDATYSGDLYPGDVERTAREGWITRDPANGDYEIGFMKQFRRVWLDGVVVLKPSNFPHYETLFTLQNKKLWPRHTVFISMNELGGSPQIVATIQISPEGLVQILYSGTSSRYMAEGHFYMLD